MNRRNLIPLAVLLLSPIPVDRRRFFSVRAQWASE